jgi:RNA polymerase sigma factor (TIGR02999 family)
MATDPDDSRKRLFEVLYPELKRLAINFMARERKDHTLQPTALVNEAFLKLPSGNELSVHDRSHLLAMAANAMRRILVDHARSRLSQKRGSGKREPLNENLLYDTTKPHEMLDLDRALDKLESMSPRQARVVEMRFFSGLTETEIAEVLKVNVRTVKRDWEIAHAWLRGELDS